MGLSGRDFQTEKIAGLEKYKTCNTSTEIRLHGKCAGSRLQVYPKMARKRQNAPDSPTRLLVRDAKFAPSRPCVLCGQPTLSTSVKCVPCIEAQFFAEELRFTREWLAAHSGMKLELGHDTYKLMHLVLFREHVRKLAWCGTRVTQPRAKRPWTSQGQFPPDICARCLAVYEGMGLL